MMQLCPSQLISKLGEADLGPEALFPRPPPLPQMPLDVLKLASCWDSSRRGRAASMAVQVGGLQIQGAAFDGARFSELSRCVCVGGGQSPPLAVGSGAALEVCVLTYFGGLTSPQSLLADWKAKGRGAGHHPGWKAEVRVTTHLLCSTCLARGGSRGRAQPPKGGGTASLHSLPRG